MTIADAVTWLKEHGHEPTRENLLRMHYAAQNSLSEEEMQAVLRDEWERIDVYLGVDIDGRGLQIREVFFVKPKARESKGESPVVLETIDNETLLALEREAEVTDAGPA